MSGLSQERRIILHRAAVNLAGPAGARAAGLLDGHEGNDPAPASWPHSRGVRDFPHAYEEGWLEGAEEAARESERSSVAAEERQAGAAA